MDEGTLEQEKRVELIKVTHIKLQLVNLLVFAGTLLLFW